MKALKIAVVTSLAVLFLLACTASHNQNGNHSATVQPMNANQAATEAAKTPPTEEKMKEEGKTAGDIKQASSIDAAALYTAQKCDNCHGADGKGNPKMKGVPDFTKAEWQKKESDAELAEQIRNGKKPMPAYKDKLSDQEIKALVAYIRTFAK